MTYSNNLLFNNVSLGPLPLKNRFIVAPMTRISASEDGVINDRIIDYYQRYAKGGFAAIISEGIYIDEKYSQGYANQPGLANAKQTETWQEAVEAVHEHGAKFIAQLMHAGAQSQYNAFVHSNISPSGVKPKGEQLSFYGGEGSYADPEAMSLIDVQDVKQSFVQAAKNAKRAGFDGVELHGANGYLLDEFLTDYSNQRRDHYGGSTSDRMQFILETIADVRDAIGPDYPVGIRLSQGKVSDSEHRWANGEDDASIIFGSLGKSEVDFIHVTDEDGAQPGFGEDSRSMAQAARDYSGLPIIANGKLSDPEKAASMIANEETDMISLGTGALANPDAPNKIYEGKQLNEFNAKNIMMPLANIKDEELNMSLVTHS
ncbi:NADH:flavin oxidoreductase [Thalassobacillus sp. CUG 92003]|uniref:oxidoreductase n=1 Tax=Thalassobacillus sp. CUG 92003 TaxID=2736641 RepID=UPI0015E70ECD|nr:NADH:flavin oxidoreductase [Thalassobacillus sp. CUG 92003]